MVKDPESKGKTKSLQYSLPGVALLAKSFLCLGILCLGIFCLGIFCLGVVKGKQKVYRILYLGWHHRPNHSFALEFFALEFLALESFAWESFAWEFFV